MISRQLQSVDDVDNCNNYYPNGLNWGVMRVKILKFSLIFSLISYEQQAAMFKFLFILAFAQFSVSSNFNFV